MRQTSPSPIASTHEQPVIEQICSDQLDPALVQKLPLEFLKSQHALPILIDGNCVAVALADPLNIEAYDAIVSVLSTTLNETDSPWIWAQPCARVIFPAQEIENAISHCYYQAEAAEYLDESTDDELEATLGNMMTDRTEDLLNIASKAPAVKLVNTILFQAVQSRASDIHIEPYESEIRVRFRVDGVLHDVMSIAKHQLAAVQSRLKIMANLNIAEHRLPQDGQSRIKIGEDLVDVRMSVIPTQGGERVVLRLLDKGRGQLGLAEIGMDNELLTIVRRLIQLPHGIILLTGPTGSGKTTTLYGALSELNKQELNILTVEDPVEYQLDGVGQMQVKPKIDLTFANCLRHILRQDPDIIMIGEIRDVETARIAIQASMTGHLVLSTLHTNNAASAMTRLIDMGIEPYLIASSVVAVIAQRLVRIICPECKTEDVAATVSMERPLFHGAGCDHCLHTGYRGRSGIFELLCMDEVIRRQVIQQATAPEIQEHAARQGMLTLRENGQQKVFTGQTTLEEICRVTQENLLDLRGNAS